jgi:hypothetical protein
MRYVYKFTLAYYRFKFGGFYLGILIDHIQVYRQGKFVKIGERDERTCLCCDI